METSGSYASGKYYRTWSGLDNLSANEDRAECGTGTGGNLISGKNGTHPRPAPLRLTNFQFNIPSTAKITEITVYYKHSKPKINGAYPTFNAPTFDLLNVSVSAKKGSAVPSTSTEYSVSWEVSPSISKVNSSSFGVSINYPANSSTNPGQIRLKNVRVKITYTNAVSGTSSSSSTSISSDGYYISPSDANGRILVVGSDGSISYVNNDSQAVDILTNTTTVSQTGASISKSRAYVGETVDITLTISASSKITSAALMYITLPDGVVFKGKKSGNGTVGMGPMEGAGYYENGFWMANFNNSNSVSVTFTVQITSLGVKTFKFREKTTNKETTTKITGVLPSANLYWEDNIQVATIDEPVEIIIGSFAQIAFERTFTVTFPNDVSVEWEDMDFTVIQQNNISTITKQLDTEENYFQCSVTFSDVGKYSITVEADNGDRITRIIKVKPSNLTLPYFTKIMIDDHICDRLGNSKEYILSSLMKLIINPNDEDLMESYEYNYRLGVFNTYLPDESTDGYLFENAEWSQPISSPNAWEDITITFAYSEEYPLIFLITGEYIESNAEDITIQYTYPCLMEKDFKESVELPGLFEYPIKEIPDVEGVCSLDLQPGQVTNIAKLYDIDLSNFLNSDEDNRVIQGVSVLFDVLNCDNPISIMCKLTSPSFPKEGIRSLNIESVFLEEENFQGIVNIGGNFDLWGLDFEDFKLSSLEDMEIDLQLLNYFEQATHIEFNNLRIVFYYVDLEESKIIAKVNGVDLRYYNVFIKDAIVKPGTNNDVKYLEVEGTDSNLAYRSNIREKEIEMEIRVPGCDIEETTSFVERLSKLLTNKRDKFNKPIPNEIELSHHPNRIWQYILEEELDLSAEYTEYEGKITLVVPSGTAYNKEPTITNAVGVNSGIAKVNPVIRFIAQGTEDNNQSLDIMLKETVSNQEWRLNDAPLDVGDLIRIDCAERKVYKIQGNSDDNEDIDDAPEIDITQYVDFNSDWFLLHEDYNFECENTALIQSVTFNERW